MRGARWEQVVAVFEQAIELPVPERERFLASACGEDSVLHTRVQAMLQADARGSPLLDATPDDLAAALSTEGPQFEGRRIGPYVVRGVLGQGGMGIVCLAVRGDVGKQVALKLVAGGLASPERVTRFLHERRVLAQLSHPHIATLLDAGVADDGTPWFAMDYVPGEAINVYCRTHALGLDGRLRIFERVCGAVSYAHQHLVVHRDIKPSNILIGEDGEPRLLDFGIAKLLTDSAELGVTRTGHHLMTPQYASPEQLRGESVTTATDVYQLGALLFELLTDQQPHPDRADPAGRTGLTAVPRPSSAMRHPSSRAAARRLRGDLDTIVAKATDLDPGRRYHSVEQLGGDVRRYLEGLPIVARPATTGYRLRKFVARHKAGTGFAAVGVLAVLGVAVAMTIQARRTEAERARAEQVSALLTEVFAGADPTVAQGDTMSVRSVLDRGAERIRANEALDPVVKARLLSVIAQAYRNLGGLPRAVTLQTEVVGLLRGAVGQEDSTRLYAQRTLGRWLAESDAREAAFGPVDEALAVARRLGSNRRGELADILNDAGFVRQRSGDHAGARPFYEQALNLFRLLPDSLEGAATTLTNLASLAEMRGDLTAADTLLREALTLRRAVLGPEHSVTARSMLSLARVLARSGRYEEAEPLVRKAAEIQRRVFTGPHPDLLRGLRTLADLQAQRGQLGEAEGTQREVLEIAREVYGDGSSEMAMGVANLAGYVQRRGRLDEAADLHADAIRRFTGLVGARHPTTAVSMTNLAWTERLRNRLAQSEELYRAALPVLDSAWAGTPRLSSILVDFGIVLDLRQRHAEAEPVLRRAVSLAIVARPAADPDVLRAKRFHGLALLQLGRHAAAESLLVDAHRTLTASYGPENQYTVAAAGDLMRLYDRWGRPAEAARYRPGNR